MSTFKGYRISSNYGFREHPMNGKKIFHAGVDLVKEHKAPIYAFMDGEVLFAGMGKSGTGLGGYGNVVVLKDENNNSQLYGHLDSVSVKKGQFIKKNDLVGYQGSTGKVTGSHLHYEIRKIAEGKPPYGYRENKEASTLHPQKYLQESPIKLVQKNTTGQTVKNLQQQLKNLGYSLPKFGVDGIFGKETEEAVKQFQRKMNIKVDGIVGPVTSKVLDEQMRLVSKYPGILQEGSRGEVVKVIQRKLNIKDDGIYGPKTTKAVKQYQTNNKLLIDGIVGKETWKHLFQ